MLPRNPNLFANSPLDRAGHYRKDETWLAAARADQATRFAVFHGGQPALRDNAACWARAGEVSAENPIFLGVDSAGAARFAVEQETAPEGAAFSEMRSAASALGADDVAMLGCARALFEWHGRHKFCANCGAPTAMVDAGWKRACPACKAEHFPRVDPVVIMLGVRGELCLLGRQTRFIAKMYSALAGFVEPGESLEEACAREMFEEAGVRVKRVSYHSTQPWPFPSSLMVGLIAEIEGEEIRVDPTELEDARWFSREEARAMLERRHPEFRAPAPYAIAHQLLKSWAYA